MTHEELYKAVEEGKVAAAIDSKGNKERLFISVNKNLCAFLPRSSRRGKVLYDYHVKDYVSFVEPKPEPTEEQKLKKEYKILVKYKTMAEKATFKNSWLDKCKALPDFETWKKDLITEEYDKPCTPKNKGLYEYGITTGNKIDGQVISLNRIAKQYPHEISDLRRAIKEQKADNYILNRSMFAGYEATISTSKTEDGQFMGYLSLEYVGCGNGYYYLLINDDNFIGYDVD